MNKFKLGDRVIYGEGPLSYPATVRVLCASGSVGIEFDDKDGHTLDDRLRSDRGWWCHDGDLTLILEVPPPPVPDEMVAITLKCDHDPKDSITIEKTHLGMNIVVRQNDSRSVVSLRGKKTKQVRDYLDKSLGDVIVE